MSAEDNSLDEFNEKVGTGIEKALHKLERALIGGDSDVPAKKEVKPGKLVQYSLYDTGYIATTLTVPVLPSGAYRLKMSTAGPWLDPVDLVTDSLIQFPDTKSDSVIEEIETFWTLKKKFSEYGFSHKRGFLLWGPPGSGKTCTVAMIVQKMIQKKGLVIIAEHPSLLSLVLAQIRSVEPDREMVVVWEDLDAVIERHGESEVLAVLDGESQVDNVVFIATTNYPEKLDSRITNRPSRFDRIEKIDMPNEEARKIFLEAKVGTTQSPDGINLIAETEGMSIAHLRELVVGVWCYGNKAKDVLARLKKMKTKPNSAHSGEPMGFGLKTMMQ